MKNLNQIIEGDKSFSNLKMKIFAFHCLKSWQFVLKNIYFNFKEEFL